MDLAPGQDDPCHLLERDEKGWQANEQEQREATLTEKGTRTATLPTVWHKHFKFLPTGASRTYAPPSVPCTAARHSP